MVVLGVVAFGQTKTITGTVTSEQDSGGIPGVSVVVKGTTSGTITDINGNFSLEASSDATLVFTFVGMKPQEIVVGDNTNLAVQLELDVIGLEEVVAIGYGTSKVKDLTAPISTVKAEDITRIAATSAMSALQGEVAGVQIMDAGAPQGTPSVRVRGVGSMGGNDPLYVVDGMFFENITWLNPNDIDNIAILKDASAAAIYGVRASGGVILVTTKSGSRNEGITIQYDGYAGIETTSNVLEMANAREYSTMMIEGGQPANLDAAIQAFGAAPDKITWQGTDYSYPNNDVDYYDELLDNGVIMNHNLSVRGGSKNADYRVSGGYYSADGRLINDHKFERINISSKVNFQPYKFLKLGTSFTVVNSNNKNNVNPWSAMYNAVPTLPLWEENGDYGQRTMYGYDTGSARSNPIVAIDQSDKYGDFNKDTRIMYNVSAEIDIFSNEKLKFRTQFAQDHNFGKSRDYDPQYQSGADWSREASELTKAYEEENSKQLDNILTYQNDFGKHGLSIMGGMSVRSVELYRLVVQANGVPWGDNGREEFLYVNKGTITSASDDQSNGRKNRIERGVSYISRLQYNYAHKYLLNATFRADGTDKFTETWGYFPSVGVGWVLSEEAFMQDQGLFDYAKIRGTWGQLGNNSVPRESGSQSLTFRGDRLDRPYTYSYIFDGDITQGYEASLAFNNLKWEITTELNIGVDLGLFDNRLSLEADWYRKVTKEAVITTAGLMGGGVIPSVDRNTGEILNRGFEFDVGWNDKIGEVGINVSANLTTLHNEVLKINDLYINGGSFERRYRTAVGEAIYSFYGKKVTGIYQNQQEIDQHLTATPEDVKPKPGYFRYEDVNDDGMIDDKDYQYLGANIPKITYGGTIALDYKGWDFSVKWYGIAGNKIQNGAFNLRSVRSHHTDQNFDKALVENRWTKEGDNTSPVDGLYYPSAEALTLGNSWNFNTLNSFLIESGSYFKVNNITLGYTFKNILPGSTNGSSVRIKLAADNPFTFFKYNGFDPNVGGIGRDDNTYPLSSNFILGVNITY